MFFFSSFKYSILHSSFIAVVEESFSSVLKALGALVAAAAAAVETERPLTGDALALADVELLVAGAEPFVGPVLLLGGDVPLMFLVASLTSWNFSMN